MDLQPRGDGGIERGPLSPNTTRTSILVAMLTLAIYMSLLVDLKVFTTFKRRNTIYFYSLLITSSGIISHSLGIILKWFVGSCPWYVNTAFASFGWWGMVTGQSLVLYSRLHLVIRSPRLLRSVLGMIVVNFCLFQVPTTVLTFGSNRADPGMFLSIYNVYERIQLIVFTLQELIISILYIRAAFNIMLLPSPFPSPSSALSSSSSPRTPPPPPPSSFSTTTPSPPNKTPFTHNPNKPSTPHNNTQNTPHPHPHPHPHPLHRTRRSLLALNTLCIILDLAFVAQVYSGEWVYKTGTQSLAYAVKLTLEFVVLNQLVDVYRLRPTTAANLTRTGGCAACSGKRFTTMGGGERGIGVGRRRGRGKGMEPLGPFFGDEEEAVGGGGMEMEMEMHEGSYTRVGLGDAGVEGGRVIEGRAKGIMVTTGIETRSERRREEDENERVMGVGGVGGKGSGYGDMMGPR